MASRLVDQSVVVAVPGDLPRFRLLGIVREFAAEALGGPRRDGRRPSRPFRLGGRGRRERGPELEGAGDLDAVARLDTIVDELRAALDWLLGPGVDSAGAFEIAARLGRFWWLRGRPRAKVARGWSARSA